MAGHRREAALTLDACFIELIHQPVRLRVMAALHTGPMDFVLLKRTIEATDGNLGAHLVILEKAGFVVTEKTFVSRKPRTSIRQTRTGQEAYAAHVAYLSAMLKLPAG